MVDQVTPELIRQYREDGAVCLRGVFGQEVRDKVWQGMQKVMANPSSSSVNMKSEGGGVFFNDYVRWQEIPEFQDFIFNTAAAEIVGRMMESDYVNFYFDHTLCKEPGTTKTTPWHHDQSYQPMDGYKNISIWMPLDPVIKENTLWFVKGSHNWDKWFYPRQFSTTETYKTINDDVTHRKYEDVPHEEIDNNPDKYPILQWTCEPGDIVIFHNKCLHGAPGNPLKTHRRVFATRWLGDDSVLAKRPWEAAPPHMGGLNYGDKIRDCEAFPEVWRRQK
ncbi:uncharacterized protein LOC135500432 [Lineus longissimus]|uniref:uncharacterized protein LOC135500432 n=1 Tax=Lineus longissimus TaxID=88925 RepID=UPI002B4DAC3E